MGSGKGAVDYWVVVIKPGNIIFELSDTIPLEIAKRALEVASQKLPIKTKFYYQPIHNYEFKYNELDNLKLQKKLTKKYLFYRKTYLI